MPLLRLFVLPMRSSLILVAKEEYDDVNRRKMRKEENVIQKEDGLNLSSRNRHERGACTKKSAVYSSESLNYSSADSHVYAVDETSDCRSSDATSLRDIIDSGAVVRGHISNSRSDDGFDDRCCDDSMPSPYDSKPICRD